MTLYMFQTVLDSWWWTERPSETCRVSFYNKMNLIHCWICWFYYKNIMMHGPMNIKFEESSCFLPGEEKNYQWNKQILVAYSKTYPGVLVLKMLWYLRTPYLLLHQLLQKWRPPKKQKRTLMTQKQQMKEISKWNAPLISCMAQA
jgi:hypothetical protein